MRGYQNLKDMGALILSTGSMGAVAFFVAIFLGRNLRLKILYPKVIGISRRFFGIPWFCYYAISGGVFRIFNRFPIKRRPKQIDPIQMLQLKTPLFSDA